MTTVTKESLAARIAELERYKFAGVISLSQEYQLKAFDMLLDRLQEEHDEEINAQEWSDGR